MTFFKKSNEVLHHVKLIAILTTLHAVSAILRVQNQNFAFLSAATGRLYSGSFTEEFNGACQWQNFFNQASTCNVTRIVNDPNTLQVNKIASCVCYDSSSGEERINSIQLYQNSSLALDSEGFCLSNLLNTNSSQCNATSSFIFSLLVLGIAVAALITGILITLVTVHYYRECANAQRAMRQIAQVGMTSVRGQQPPVPG